MSIFVIPGPQALSQFRVDNLVKDINAYTNSTSIIEEVRSCFVHYIDSKSSDLPNKDYDLLQVLLTYDSPLDVNNDPLSKKLFDAVSNEDVYKRQLLMK